MNLPVSEGQQKPNPGSDEAIKQGCRCAVLDNRHGKGAFDFPDGQFWINEECPIHGGNTRND